MGMKEIIKAFKDAFTAEELNALKKEVQLSEQKPVVTLSEEKTKDGKVLSFDGEIAVNTQVMEVTAEGSQMANGEYELENGKIVTAQDGIVVDVKEPAVAEVVTVEEMKAQLSSHKKEIENYSVLLSKQKSELMKEIDALKETNKVLLSSVQKILETPLQVAQTERKAKPVEEMTNYEILLKNRGKL